SRNTHAPLTLPGMLSTAGHWDQSRVAMILPSLCRLTPLRPSVQDDAPLSGRGLLRRESVPSALLHFCRKVAHGLLRDDAAFASGNGDFSLIECNENFRAGALAFFPQGKGFLHRVFFAVKPSALNCLTDKRLLVRCELYFHRLHGTEKPRFRQVASWTCCKLDPFSIQKQSAENPR